MACVFIAASEAATQAMNAPRFTQGSALDAYLEATKSAKKGARAVKAAVPEPTTGASGQDSVSSAQESASSAISSLTEGEAPSKNSAGPSALCVMTHWMSKYSESSCALYLHVGHPFSFLPLLASALCCGYSSSMTAAALHSPKSHLCPGAFPESGRTHTARSRGAFTSCRCRSWHGPAAVPRRHGISGS